uniref:Uncharacterized protein n=1 Tax=Oryza glumipatula TaxID=40148 RepID=A0A0D9YAR4_9ORYZ
MANVKVSRFKNCDCKRGKEHLRQGKLVKTIADIVGPTLSFFTFKKYTWAGGTLHNTSTRQDQLWVLQNQSNSEDIIPWTNNWSMTG